jgi:predicted ATPase/class 3 adenylate cyclase
MLLDPPALPTASPAPGVHTFLIADVRGYTRFTQQHGDEAAARLATRFAALAREGVAQHGGQVLELRGDEALAVFVSARQALRAALDLQTRFAQETQADPTLSLPVGMGLDAGEAVPVEGGYRGRALNLAARLCSLAGPGEVFTSAGVVHLAGPVEGLAYVERGQVQLKGLAEPVRVLHVLPEGGVPASLPPLVAAVARPSTLPAAPTPFIGREREVAAVRKRLLEPETRLLTLTGPGGTGKTRLALQVANQVLDAFSDGVYFVALAALRDPTLVLPTIAQTLEVREADGRPLGETLHAFLHAKRLLLVLDNCEQVLDAAPEVAALLAACPQVRVLATSRAVLHLRGERLYAVPPLALPQTAPLPPLRTLTQYEAVRLFIARAQDVKPDFAVTNATAPAVAEICVRLDGLPLAIELAAARIKLLAPPALLARLSKRLPLLVGGARDLPERQRTLRATLDWSYSLLSPEEQVLFARLSVFRGGRTLEAIEAICNSEGDLDVLAGVESLLEKSLLVQTEVAGETRFVLLETIHEYARERLEASGEAEAVRRAHAAYFQALAEEAEPALEGPQQGVWLACLEREHDNLRAALGWALETGEGEIGLGMTAALWRFWEMRGHLSEGRRWCERVLDQRSAAAAPRAKALTGAGTLAWQQGDYARATALHEEALALYREIGDQPGIAFALNNLGVQALDQGDHERAVPYFEQSLALARDVGATRISAFALHNLGEVARHQGAYGRAQALYEECLALLRRLGDSWVTCMQLIGLARVAQEQGNDARAMAFCQESLPVCRDTGCKDPIATCLEGVVTVACAQGQFERVAHLCGAAAALREAIGAPIAPADRAGYERTVAAARAALGDDAFAAAWAVGQTWQVDEAIAAAEEVLARLADAQQQPSL